VVLSFFGSPPGSMALTNPPGLATASQSWPPADRNLAYLLLSPATAYNVFELNAWSALVSIHFDILKD
jgi:hypothetical protein